MHPGVASVHWNVLNSQCEFGKRIHLGIPIILRSNHFEKQPSKAQPYHLCIPVGSCGAPVVYFGDVSKTIRDLSIKKKLYICIFCPLCNSFIFLAHEFFWDSSWRTQKETHTHTHTQQAQGPTLRLRLEHRLCYSSCYLCARSRCAFCFVLGGAIYDSKGLEDGSMSLWSVYHTFGQTPAAVLWFESW